MIETLKNAWKVKELRNKILFTIFIIVIFRIGSVIPVPYINVSKLWNATTTNDFFNYLSILTGGGLEYGAIFAMSVTPYINSSIIIQLLCVAIPALERLSKEGEEGQKKLATITRYTTVVLSLIQGTAYYFYLRNSGFLSVSGSGARVFAAFVIVLAFTAGSALVMWLGEQIDIKGIGNGISILLFAGILSRGPQAFEVLIKNFRTNPVAVVGIVIAFFVVIGFIVWMTDAERRIPVQYAKRVVGNKMYGGQNTHIPIKVNMSGVMPIIFASSILMLPTMILSFAGDNYTIYDQPSWHKFLTLFSTRGVFYAVIYFIMIIAFAYFYTTIQFNPVEMANNLRKNGGAIPGIRPGKPSSDFISKILSRITLIGALFLSVIAILPIAIGNIGKINVSLGGTSILIMVGVALDTVKNLESQMMMRHYKGFLD